MQIQRPAALVFAGLIGTALVTAASASGQPCSRSHPVARAVGDAIAQDTRNAAERKIDERSAGLIPAGTVHSIWGALASHLPRHKEKPEDALPAPATSAPDCR